MAYCVQICVIFCDLVQFLGSSVGRASDFGSGGPNRSGLWVASGTNFFFHFLLRIDARRHLVAKTYPMDAVLQFYTLKLALKTRFFELQLLRTTERVYLS